MSVHSNGAGESNLENVIVIGSGPAGFTAGTHFPRPTPHTLLSTRNHPMGRGSHHHIIQK